MPVKFPRTKKTTPIEFVYGEFVNNPKVLIGGLLVYVHAIKHDVLITRLSNKRRNFFTVNNITDLNAYAVNLTSKVLIVLFVCTYVLALRSIPYLLLCVGV